MALLNRLTPHRAVLIPVITASGIAALWLVRREKLKQAGGVISLVAVATVVETVLRYGLWETPMIMLMPILLVMVALLVDWRAATLVLIGLLLLVSAVALWLPHGYAPDPERFSSPATLWAYLFPILLAGGFWIIDTLRSREQMQHDLEQRTDQLGTSERRLAQLLDASPDAIVEFDTEGIIVSSNVAAQRSGLVRSPCQGEHVTNCTSLHPLAPIISQAQASGSDHAFRSEPVALELRDEDGLAKWYEAVVADFQRTDGSQGIIAVLRDITLRRQNEAARSAIMQREAEAQRLESIGRLAGGVAHDFNNILTVLMANAGELGMEDITPSDRMELAAEMTDASEAGARLTRQLLAFSRKQVVAPRELDLRDELERQLPMLRRLLGEHVPLKLDMDCDNHLVLMDPGEFEQVVLNLCVNARDAMPEGGTITVALEPAQEGAPGCELQVSDEGVGIAPEDIERIFEPFFTTKREGTGLGLATVRAIAERNGGTILAQARPEGGTRFVLRLPRHEPVGRVKDIQAGQVQVPASAPHQRQIRVLVAEDEEMIQRSVTRILESAGHQVKVCHDGQEAHQLFAEDPTAWDLVLSDVVMPRMSGPQLLTQLERLRPEMPVLFMSGYTDHELLRQKIAERDVRLLDKPFTAEVLLEAVAGTLESTGSNPHQ